MKFDWKEVDLVTKWKSLPSIPISQEHDNVMSMCVRARGRGEGTGGGIRPRGTLRTAGVRGTLWGQRGWIGEGLSGVWGRGEGCWVHFYGCVIMEVPHWEMSGRGKGRKEVCGGEKGGGKRDVAEEGG